ncbi:hypothetical protein [Desulfurispira natronophila]|uniref:Uncharacterized protein n=1 Tax=Desulfurispira natronophila TaxID=682562 RepID=A0A7W7Y674_9BACT|nr:hypothetical protein [Desulfurispira natronophila]MBB5022850.1 hypothetical protein [Desulfurispira natronophila]
MRDQVINSIARRVGLSANEIRDLNPVDIAKHLQSKLGKKLTFSSEFPSIGRGNVLRDGIKTSQVIDEDIDRILDVK